MPIGFIVLVIVLSFVILSNGIIAYKLINGKDMVYSYKNIIYYGISIFNFFFMAIMIFFSAKDGLNISLHAVEAYVLSTIQYFCIILLPIIVIGFLPIIKSNISLIRYEGKHITNILGIIFFIAFVIGTMSIFIISKILNNFMVYTEELIYIPEIYLCISEILQFIFACITTYFECIFLGVNICSLIAVKRKVEYNKDIIIILGCKIKKDGTLTNLLKGRVDRAIKFSNEQLKKTGKKVIFIPSGGKGEDEVIAEAEAMKNYLLKKGISEDDIIVENNSTTTLENMKFSKVIIDRINPNANVIFSTTNYHVFRAGIISNKVGLNAEGICSKTKWYFWPNALLREFVGVIWYKKLFHIVAILILISSTTLMLIKHRFMY